MEVTAHMVRRLRELTGAGMMECKKTLTEAKGDVDEAVNLLRKKGMASADKKATRIAAEGVIALVVSEDAKKGLLLELNCETDFVAKGDEFQSFADTVARAVLENELTEVEKINALVVDGQSVEESRRAIVSKVGENISLRRVALIRAPDDGMIGAYRHGTRIGVLVAIKGCQESQLGKDIAMHVAASQPLAISVDDVDQSVLQREREIYKAQALESGKPMEIAEKMVAGRMKKYLNEVTLLGQPFVKNPDQSVSKLLSDNGAEASAFSRFEVGEGIEKKQENFADEVKGMANSVK